MNRARILPFLFFFSAAPATAAESFIRGEVNQDFERDLSDPLGIIGYLFLGAGRPAGLEAADADDSGLVDLTDAVNLISYLFLGGSQPEPPFPGCGQDPTPDALGCERFVPCGGVGPGELFPTGRFKAGREPSWLTVADLDGDGRLDALVSNSASLHLSLLRGAAGGPFQAQEEIPVAETPYFHTVRDFNRDGARIGRYSFHAGTSRSR
jgi:hypothetical protein